MSVILLYAIVVTTLVPVEPGAPGSCESADEARTAPASVASGVRTDADVRALFAAYSQFDASGIAPFIRDDIEHEEPGHGIHTVGVNGIARLWEDNRRRYGSLRLTLERIAWLGPSIVLVEGTASTGSLSKEFLTTLRLDSLNRIHTWTEHWATDDPPVDVPPGLVDDHIVMNNGIKRAMSWFAPSWVFADKTWQVRTSDKAELLNFGRRSNPAGITGLSVHSTRRVGPRTFAFEGAMHFKGESTRGFSVIVLLDSTGRVIHRTDHFDITGLRF